MNNIRFIIYLLLLTCITAVTATAQSVNWQNKDLKIDSLFGVSTEKAYQELLNGKTSQTVIVGVIDAGVDTLHEDLKGILWINPKKKRQDNGTYGWSFIGSSRGNVHYDNLELTRQVRRQQERFEGKDSNTLKGSDLAAFHQYEAEKRDLEKQKRQADQMVQGMNNFGKILDGIVAKIGKANPTLADFITYVPVGDGETQIRKMLINVLQQKDDFKAFEEEQFDKELNHYKELADYQLNIGYDPRPTVGDDYYDLHQLKYGSPDVMGPDATHGTHVSGIIGAVRHNGIGLDGIADNVQLLNIRTIPDGDERDKDVANAIRYAADHGAKVINMSFGKSYSPDKSAVDEAIKYAMKKDVLVVQAAGNDNQDIDSLPHFPNPNYLKGGKANAYIVVGASSWKDDETLKAPFSNYGKVGVDVFAPGEQIYSAIPGSKYARFDGTSMASPVVAGLAALIREYYPKLKAIQVKEIILASVVKINHPVYLENAKDNRTVSFTDLCGTGGIVNAYRALQMAATYK